MLPMFGLSLFLNENAILPVALQDASGGELTGYLASTVIVATSINGGAMTTITPASWVELGNGLYEFTMLASSLSVEGSMMYRAQTSPAGTNLAFNGFAKVEHRLDKYECRVAPYYDAIAQTFKAYVWLDKNGQTITNPASCQLWVKDSAGTVVVNETSASANADGAFAISVSSLALVRNTNYECKVRVIDASGNTWTTLDGTVSFPSNFDQYEVRGSPQYDEVTQEFSTMVCLLKNGQVITNPLTCQIWLKDTSGNIPVNLTSVLPNADGVFILEASSIALALNMNYELKMTVTNADGTWTTVDYAITFN